MLKQTSALVKTAIFTVLVPGTVGGYLPYRLTRGAVWRPPTDWIGYVSVLPLAFGLALYLRCAWQFAVDGLGTPAPIDPPKTLVVRGPYRLTRNPMYIAVLSVLVGEMLLVQSTILAEYGLVVSVAFYSFVVFYEEPVLRRKFGSAYEDYCAAVPRWIVNASRAASEWPRRPSSSPGASRR